jgi:transcriptional regulator with XRE-family HTH domain
MLSQKQLADESGVSLRTVQGFEANKRALQSLALSAIERVFVDQGIVLISDLDWSGVKISNHHQPK